MSEVVTLEVADSAAMEALGARLARVCPAGVVIFLRGELGAGKTSLVRGFLHELGHVGAVKSPTYTLVEPYQLGEKNIYHFDLYRLGDAGELEYLGLRDYLDAHSICLIEWPERAPSLPSPDLELQLIYLVDGRKVQATAQGSKGRQLLRALS